ncbi:helix-turn-helix transcriptional regulator [Streptomyces sp. NPDC088752]|uniref:helix-turn-helix domain-containing protein n=1 Tax=Streptomyces sp. NPDC088752 TaxID=3154963 RepID=UPI003423C04A
MIESTDREDGPRDAAAYFGEEVKALRKSLGLSQEEFATKLKYNQGQVSKVENGAVMASEPFAKAMDRVAGTPGVYLRLRNKLAKRGIPDWFAPYVELEKKAAVVKMFHPTLLPGLVQIRPYAEEVLRAGRPTNFADLIRVRMERQEILTRDEDPARLWLILNESALRNPVHSPETMRAQLRHLHELAETPRHRVQIIPKEKINNLVVSPFGLLTFTDGPDVAHVDGFPRGFVLSEPDDVLQAQDAYDLLVAKAAPPDETAELINSIVKDCYS